MHKKIDDRPILSVEHLSLSFRMYEKGLRQKDLRVLHDMNFTVLPGEVVAVVGSSGSGKSLLAHSILGILPGNSHLEGRIRYRGEVLTQEAQKNLRGSAIALVPQSVAYLDPLMRVGRQVKGVGGDEGRMRAAFDRYGLSRQVERLYPFQLSGGMARRVLVSTAVIGDAELIVADEPTPGLSAALAKEALNTFRELADEGKGVMLITHDIDLALSVADRVAVFYGGTVVETAPAEDFQAGPQALRHPYTKALWAALPQNGFTPIPGSQPYPGEVGAGCLFAPRCPHRTAACEEEIHVRPLRGGEVVCVHAT